MTLVKRLHFLSFFSSFQHASMSVNAITIQIGHQFILSSRHSFCFRFAFAVFSSARFCFVLLNFRVSHPLSCGAACNSIAQSNIITAHCDVYVNGHLKLFKWLKSVARHGISVMTSAKGRFAERCLLSSAESDAYSFLPFSISLNH